VEVCTTVLVYFTLVIVNVHLAQFSKHILSVVRTTTFKNILDVDLSGTPF